MSRAQVGRSMRYFLCNTDRAWSEGEFGRLTDETNMHERRRAAAWVEFSYPDHMRRARKDDLIFMFASGVGLIGVGRATGPCRVLPDGHPDRVAPADENREEWQIPVVWLRWQTANPCVWDIYPIVTFIDISGSTWNARRQRALRHFGL